MIMIRALCLIVSIITLWAMPPSTSLYAADDSPLTSVAYYATRALVTDCQLDPYQPDGTMDIGGPDTGTLPQLSLYAGQSCVSLDQTDVTGALNIVNEGHAMTSLAYDFQVCLPCLSDGGSSWSCQRECYSLGDNARTISYTGDGRIYTVASSNGSQYDIHFIRRSSDASRPDPSAIFQVTRRESERSISFLLIYRMVEAD